MRDGALSAFPKRDLIIYINESSVLIFMRGSSPDKKPFFRSRFCELKNSSPGIWYSNVDEHLDISFDTPPEQIKFKGVIYHYLNKFNNNEFWKEW